MRNFRGKGELITAKHVVYLPETMVNTWVVIENSSSIKAVLRQMSVEWSSRSGTLIGSETTNRRNCLLLNMRPRSIAHTIALNHALIYWRWVVGVLSRFFLIHRPDN